MLCPNIQQLKFGALVFYNSALRIRRSDPVRILLQLKFLKVDLIINKPHTLLHWVPNQLILSCLFEQLKMETKKDKGETSPVPYQNRGCHFLVFRLEFVYFIVKMVYSGDPNTRLVRILNGWKQFGSQMVWMLNAFKIWTCVLFSKGYQSRPFHTFPRRDSNPPRHE